MSDYNAIKAVTETLKAILEDGMSVADVTVTIAPLDLVREAGNDVDRINLYLYKAEENVFLKNQEIPGAGNPAAYGAPPLSLVLYYLMTAIPLAEKNSPISTNFSLSLLLKSPCEAMTQEGKGFLGRWSTP